MPASEFLPRGDAAARDEMRSLLAAYATLDQDGRRRLAHLMKKAAIVDVAMISSYPLVADAYHRFKHECAALMRPTAIETALFLSFYLIPSAIIVWVVMAVK